MARKKTVTATRGKEKVSKSKLITKKTKAKSAKRESYEPLGDSGLIVIDDDLEWNKEMEIEERRAYLEEARSQEAFD